MRKDGVYTIDPDGLGSFQVRCDMSTDGGGWTVFQKRQDGSQNFFLEWSDYKAGFGNLSGEFWLGLDKIHRLTKSGQNVLRVDLMDFNDAERYAKYGTFSLADESNKYRLIVGNYSGIPRLTIFSCRNVAWVNLIVAVLELFYFETLPSLRHHFASLTIQASRLYWFIEGVTLPHSHLAHLPSGVKKPLCLN